MFNKFKKAYISIEVVILASIVIIGGMCGLSAFLKNGQNAQSQSAEAMNNAINMIGEEFDFNIGSGELPGGGNSPDDDTPEGMNEYGFFFNKNYTLREEFENEIDGNGYMVISYYFTDYGEINVSSYLHGNAVFEYQNKTAYDAKYGGVWGTFSQDGLHFFTRESTEDITYTLAESSAANMNEYGFYYGVEYCGINLAGQSESLIFYENGSLRRIMHMNPISDATYEESKVYIYGELFGTFTNEGKEFNDELVYPGATLILEE